ncbi:MAG: alpha/beta hydrolase [Erysipelotrichaceae bacterium]|nr:alpha/beta hydrolase [Erysipelotrichaceae bacterium]
MRYREYGKENRDTVMLLHGGGLSWWNYKEAAELLQDRYHVILPILDGHALSDRHFTSIEDNAEEIIYFIDRELGGSLRLIGGLSLGAQTVLEILSQRNDISEYALIESAAVIPSKLTNALIGPAFGSSYGLIKKRSFARMQFASLHIKEELFEDYYRDTCLIEKEDMIAFLKASTSYTLKKGLRKCSTKALLITGERENREIRSSLRLILTELKGSTARIVTGLHHGEYSLNHADEYVKDLERLMEGQITKGYNRKYESDI